MGGEHSTPYQWVREQTGAYDVTKGFSRRVPWNKKEGQDYMKDGDVLTEKEFNERTQEQTTQARELKKYDADGRLDRSDYQAPAWFLWRQYPKSEPDPATRFRNPDPAERRCSTYAMKLLAGRVADFGLEMGPGPDN